MRELVSLLLFLVCINQWVTTSCMGHGATVRRYRTKVDEGQEHWNQIGADEIAAALKVKRNTNVAKNVILFLGDGMSIATLTASRIYKGQQEGKGGEEGKLTFEDFPHMGISKTYCTDKQVADSASSATAFLTGVKTNWHNVGVDNTVLNKNCSTFSEDSKVDSIVKWAQDAGKKTGVITSTRITHATPAGAYAHTPDRFWECDSHIRDDYGDDYLTECENVTDIATQLIKDEPGASINVIMGGGLQAFEPTSHDLRFEDDWDCERLDGVDLIAKWKEMKGDRSHEFVTDKTNLMKVDDNTEYLLGLFDKSHLPWEHEKIEEGLDVPTLADMTEKSINMLAKGDNGYFLLVEGGRIDHAHHDNTAHKALDEAVAMDRAVEAALRLTDEEDTLIVVTADHAHAMSFNGYPHRGAPVTGLASLSHDGLPLTTLMYNMGPGFNYTTDENGAVIRWNLTETDVNNYNYVYQGEVYNDISNHGGEDVAIYARGPMSHLFHSLHEQNYIAHAMAYAACIGSNTDIGKHCQQENIARSAHAHGRSTGSIAVIVAGAVTSITLLAGVLGLIVKKL